MLQVGVGMTPRGEVALIVALIGLQMNMISQRAYALVIMMNAITTIVPPPLLKVLFAPPVGGARRVNVVVPSARGSSRDATRRTCRGRNSPTSSRR